MSRSRPTQIAVVAFPAPSVTVKVTVEGFAWFALVEVTIRGSFVPAANDGTSVVALASSCVIVLIPCASVLYFYLDLLRRPRDLCN